MTLHGREQCPSETVSVECGSHKIRNFLSADHQDSMMTSSHFLLQPTSSIPLDLIDKAAAEVDTEGATAADPAVTSSAKSESSPVLQWSQSCQQILTVWVNAHYKKISGDSPEFKIVNRPKVKQTGGHVHKLLPGQTYALPGSSSSVYVAIPLGTTGHPTVEVKEPDNKTTRVPWDKGSLLYLAGVCKLVCDGDGAGLCILLRMSYEKE